MEFWVSGEKVPVQNIIQSFHNDVQIGLSAPVADGQLVFDQYLLVDDEIYGGLDGSAVSTTTTTNPTSTSSENVSYWLII